MPIFQEREKMSDPIKCVLKAFDTMNIIFASENIFVVKKS
jgi:hypothetical protein